MEKGKLKGMFASGNIPSGAEYKAALQDVLQAFPYFQLAQVLFAKQMYDTHEPEASGRIKLASVYAPDRKAMYLLFKTSIQPTASSQPPKTDTIKPNEKSEVKYNFIYSSTTAENSGVTHNLPIKESEPASLSEAFLRKELEPVPSVQTPVKEQEKVAASASQKTEEKKTESPKLQPFISVNAPTEKAVPVEEKKVEIKKAETTYTPTPPKKPYVSPTIEKKKSLDEKKAEPAVVKPLASVKSPVEKSVPVIDKKIEVKKPEPIAASAKKPYTPPTIEKKRNLYQTKVTEKKPEEPKVQTPVIEKPPVEKAVSAPVITNKVIEKKPEEPKVQTPVIEKPPVEKAVSAPVITNKVIEKKPEEPKVQTPVIEKPPVEKAVSAPVITNKVTEKKPEEPKIPAPVIEKPPVVSKPTSEEKVTQPEQVTPVEAVAPVEIETSLVEDKKVEEPVTPVTVEKEAISSIEPITDTNLKYSFNSWLKVLPEIGVEKKHEKKLVSQEETSDIIAKFLKKEPSISRPKAEFFSPVKAAKMSITDDDSIVSETLAKIYLEQGNLSKALKAYQTLLLQLPEKKNIFAPRIEKIKALIRENTKPGTK